MELHDPVAAYNAATNVEAHLVKNLLVDAGIEAYASEDFSTGGLWMFGTLPEIHKPQVWVSARDLPRARTVVKAYEARVAEGRASALSPGASGTGTIEVYCEECQQYSDFPVDQIGTVQDCPRCAAYVDVGDVDESDQYWLEGDDDDEDGDEPYDDGYGDSDVE